MRLKTFSNDMVQALQKFFPLDVQFTNVVLRILLREPLYILDFST